MMLAGTSRRVAVEGVRSDGISGSILNIEQKGLADMHVGKLHVGCEKKGSKIAPKDSGLSKQNHGT